MSTDDSNIDDSLSVHHENLLDTVPIYLATAFFLLTILLATIQVIMRQVPFSIDFLFWTEPTARYVLIVMTYLGTAIAVRNNENVKIDLFQRWLQENIPSLYHVVTVLISLTVLCFVYVVVQGAINGATEAWNSGTNLPYLTYGMIHATIGVSTILIGIYTLYDLYPYARFVIGKVTGSSYSLPDATPEPKAETLNEQTAEDEASVRAQDLMGLSESNDEGVVSDEANVKSDDSNEGVIRDE